MIGGQGADVLDGVSGDDVLIGDEGVDTFRFDRTLLDKVSDTDTIQNFDSEDVLDFADHVGAGGSVDVIRVTSGFLQIELSGEDVIHVFGQSNALDIAVSQLSSVCVQATEVLAVLFQAALQGQVMIAASCEQNPLSFNPLVSLR